MTEPTGAGTLRVAMLNIFAHHGGWPERRSVLADGFRQLAPDLIALQEVVKTEQDDQAAEILGDGYHLVHQTQGKVDEVGIAIASRYPIRDVHEVDLKVMPRMADVSTFALVVEINAPEQFGPLIFATYPTEYRPAFELDRERQAVAAARVLEPLVDEHRRHVIVAGDMNADPDAASMRFWTGRQSMDGTSVCYRNTWESVHPGEPGPTFTPENALMAKAIWDWPFRQIDHILVSCGEGGQPTLAITSCVRIFDRPVDGVWGSDHFGVMADLAVPPGSGAAS